MTNQAKIRLAGESNRGMVRQRNEDSFCIVSRDGESCALAIVADGIGGHRDGDVASFFCCQQLLLAWDALDRENFSAADAERFLYDGIRRANRSMFEHNRRSRSTLPMGTTVAAAVFLPEKVIVSHAGDSRVYRWTPTDGLRQLTLDHTLEAKLEQAGMTEELKSRPNLANVISRAVGPRWELDLEVLTLERVPDERYLFCTDGLSRYIDPDILEKSIGHAENARAAVGELMRVALIAGGWDNITIVCGFGEEEREEKP